MDKNIIIIGTHGRFGEELIKSAEMIIGKIDNVKVFSLLPDMSPEEYSNDIESILKELPNRTLCLTDIFGGTPFNTFAILSKKYGNEVVTGLNLPMLIEALDNIDSMNIDEVLKNIENSSKDAIKIFSNILNKK